MSLVVETVLPGSRPVRVSLGGVATSVLSEELRRGDRVRHVERGGFGARAAWPRAAAHAGLPQLEWSSGDGGFGRGGGAAYGLVWGTDWVLESRF